MGFETGILAPLQTIMLRDSLTNPGEGLHVEQLEIVFQNHVQGDRVMMAWNSIVEHTAVLGMGFAVRGDEPVGLEKRHLVPTFEHCEFPGTLEERWLVEDRGNSLLDSECLPWRMAFWPDERRLIWTFHHALLDGRSITRIVKNFLQCVEDGRPPQPLALSVWQPASDAAVRNLGEILEKDLSGFAWSTAASPDFSYEKQTFCMGEDCARELVTVANDFGVTPSSLLTWAWGQAVAQVSGAEAAIVEQVRCGPPQPGTAGFTMNTLPLVIPRAHSGSLGNQLRSFRAKLLAMREFETVAPHQLPEKVLEATNGPWSSVLMTEHGTLPHMAGCAHLVESIKLGEFPGESLTATACLFPDVRLEVEGGGNRDLMEAWKSCISAIL